MITITPPDQNTKRILFSQYVDLYVSRTRDHLQALQNAYKFPHASNFLVAKLYSPMGLAREFQTTYVQRADPKTYEEWIKYALENGRQEGCLFFVDEPVEKTRLLMYIDARYRDDASVCIHSLEGPFTNKVDANTGDPRKDVRRIYYLPSNIPSVTKLINVYMSTIDDDDINKTDIDFVVLMP